MLFTKEKATLGTTVIRSSVAADVPLTIQDDAGTTLWSLTNAGVLAIPTVDKFTIASKVIPNTLTETVQIIGTSAATTTNYRPFFIADRGYTVLGVSEVHGTAGSDGSAVTVMVEKCTGTQATGAGVTLQTGTFDLKGTANTVQAGVVTATAADLVLAAGNRLGLVLTGTPTAVANVVVTVQLMAS